MPIKDGASVTISAGDFKGCTGIVVGHHNHEPVTYAVQLSKPVVKAVKNEVDMGGGRKAVTEEDITFTRVEVAEADLGS